MYEEMYRSLYLIRRAEEEVANVYPTDKIKSPVHLSIGQEAVSVGICQALRPEDVAFGTYRSHALYLAKGGDLKKMIAELYGKETGCARGKGGSMHMIDLAANVMGTSAVVGTTIPNAVGYAYALKYRKSDAIVVSFFGDGGSEEGVCYESFNFAVLKKLPILFVCENNGYAIHTHQKKRQGRPDVRAKAEAFGLTSELVEGNDTVKLYEVTKDFAARLRAGEGPFFIESQTYRWREHVGPGEDFQLGFREESEREPWMSGDQLKVIGEKVSDENRKQIELEVEEEVKEAFAFAEESPFPQESELLEHVYKA